MKKFYKNISLVLLSLFMSIIAWTQNEKKSDNNKANSILDKNDSTHNGLKDSLNNDIESEAKIVMEIETNSNGEVISAEYISKKSSGSISKEMIDIAKRRSHQLKLGANVKGTVIFKFKILK